MGETLVNVKCESGECEVRENRHVNGTAYTLGVAGMSRKK